MSCLIYTTQQANLWDTVCSTQHRANMKCSEVYGLTTMYAGFNVVSWTENRTFHRLFIHEQDRHIPDLTIWSIGSWNLVVVVGDARHVHYHNLPTIWNEEREYDRRRPLNRRRISFWTLSQPSMLFVLAQRQTSSRTILLRRVYHT